MPRQRQGAPNERNLMIAFVHVQKTRDSSGDAVPYCSYQRDFLFSFFSQLVANLKTPRVLYTLKSRNVNISRNHSYIIHYDTACCTSERLKAV